MPLFGKKYRLLSDEELLKRFSENENAVIEELYNRYRILTMGLALKYLKDKESAKDAVAEIFLKLKADLSRQDVKCFKSWFYVFSKNYCLQYIRKTKRKKDLELNYSANCIDLEYDHEIDAMIEKVQRALPQLKAGQKQCVEQFYLNQKSYDEISRLLSISIKQVKSHIQNGKRNLLNNLGSENKTP